MVTHEGGNLSAVWKLPGKKLSFMFIFFSTFDLKHVNILYKKANISLKYNP